MPVTYVVLSILLGSGVQQDMHSFGEILPDCGSAACVCRAGHRSRKIMPARCKADGTCPSGVAAQAEASPQRDVPKGRKASGPQPLRRGRIVRKALLRLKNRRQPCDSDDACRRPLRRLGLRCRR